MLLKLLLNFSLGSLELVNLVVCFLKSFKPVGRVNKHVIMLICIYMDVDMIVWNRLTLMVWPISPEITKVNEMIILTYFVLEKLRKH